MVFWNIVFAIASFVLLLLLAPKPQNAKPASLEDFEAPTAEEGREIPVLFGTRQIKGPNVVWYGDFRAKAIKGPKQFGFFGDRQTIGYKYFLGMHMGLCHSVADHLTNITVGDDKVLLNELKDAGPISINKPGILGSNQGGISGTLDFETGGPNQLQNDYLVGVLGSGVPAHRGITGVVLRRMYLGNSAYLQPWAFTIQRILIRSDGTEQWYSLKAGIGGIPEEVTGSYSGSAYSPQLDLVVIGSNLAGSTNFISVSTDGLTWTTVNVGSHRSGQIVWSSERGIFVSVGIAGIMTSTNGFTWTSRASSFNPFGVAWSPQLGRFVATGGANYSLYSSDGITWLDGNATVGGGVIIWSPTRSEFVVIGNGPHHGYRSFDGINWTTHLGINVYTFDKGIWISDFNKYVGARDNGRLYYSETGIGGWIEGNNAPRGFWGGFAYSPSKEILVAVTVDLNTSSDPLVATSTDGINWTSKLWPNPNANLRNVTWASHLNAFVMQAEDQIWFSENGLDWIPRLPGIELDMNPAHIIREALTDKLWGMGYNESDIDDVSFTAAADTLFAEEFGLSILWSREEVIEEFITVILSHIDAVLYVSRETGKFVLKLIRDDYDIETLPIYDEDDVVTWEEVDHRQPAEAVNSIIVKYHDSVKRDDASHAVHNIAQIQQVGKISSTTRNYPGITKTDLAIRVATRDLKSLGVGFISGRFTGKRTFEELYPGDPFRLVSSRHELAGEVVRVIDMDFGDGRDNAITIKFVQDIFSLGETLITTDPGTDWVPPFIEPDPVEDDLVQEMTYYGLINHYGETDVVNILNGDSDAGILQAAATKPTEETVTAEMWIQRPGSAEYEFETVIDLAPRADLAVTLAIDATVVSIENGVDLDLVDVGSVAYIGGEIVRVDALSDTSITLGRGCLDTVPKEHAAGTTIVFHEEFQKSDSEIYTAAQSLDVKFLTQTSRGLLELADAPARNVTFNSRAFRPLRPAKVRVNGEGYGSVNINAVDPIPVTWANRNRLTELTPLDWEDDSVSPEDGQTTTIETYNGLGVLQNTFAGISGTSHNVPSSAFGGTSSGKIRIYSERDYYESFNYYEIVVILDSGYGFNYGFNYGGA